LAQNNGLEDGGTNPDFNGNQDNIRTWCLMPFDDNDYIAPGADD